MNNTNIKTILKHPFIGTSLNLIETFLIVGYDTNEILLSISKTTKQKLAFSNKSSYEYRKQRLIEEIYPTESKVSIVSEICSNNSKSIIPYDTIINKCFPYKSDTIYLNLQEHNYPFSYQIKRTIIILDLYISFMNHLNYMIIHFLIFQKLSALFLIILTFAF